ncbi:hypothetical protein Trydic_g12890 [Trypoxylus dichotomus]
MFWNAQGITKKKNKLRAFIIDNEIDVALLSETFLKAIHTFNIPNYITYRTDPDTKPGGGTAILVRKEIKHYSIGTNTATMETTAVHIHTKRGIIALYAAYSSPHDNIEEADIDAVFNSHHPTILAGGLNSKHPQWNSKTLNQHQGKQSKTLHPNAKTVLNNITNEITKDLAEHYNDQWDAKIESINDDDTKLWKITKILKTKKEKIPLILGTRGIINNNSDKTKEFANYFEGTFRPNPPVDRDHEKFSDVINKQVYTEYKDVIDVQETTTVELRNIVKTLADRKPPGHNGITNTTITHLTFEAVDTLKEIINAIIRHQYYPKTWKHATMIIIHKSGKLKHKTYGYRPISLLPELSKIVVRVIQKRLLSIVEEKSIIPGFQFGFRRKNSTTQQLLRMSEHITSNMDKSTPTAAIMLDIEKALDKV